MEENEIVLEGNIAIYNTSGRNPLRLKVEPYGLAFTTPKVKSIEYVWGDGESETIIYKPNGYPKRIPNNRPQDLRFPNEVGNPLNYSVSHIFFSKPDLDLTRYTVNIYITYFGLSAIDNKKINVTLQRQDLESTPSAMFREFHLLKTRMYGPDNAILYTFETKNPNYILMSNVKWQLRPEKDLPQLLPPVRPYRFLLPFEARFSTLVPLNSSVENIPIVRRGNRGVNVIDRGGGGL